MKRLLLIGVLLCAPLGACQTVSSAFTPASAQEHQTETKVVIDADAAFIAAATALNDAEATGKMTASQVAAGEKLRVQAHKALVLIRSAADARQTPDVGAFYQVLTDLNNLTKAFK